MYNREAIRLEDVTSAAKSKEKDIKETSGLINISEGHMLEVGL